MKKSDEFRQKMAVLLGEINKAIANGVASSELATIISLGIWAAQTEIAAQLIDLNERGDAV